MTINPVPRPLPPGDWDVSIHDIREQLVAPPNLHATMANHPALLKAWMAFRNHMVHGASVDRRELEIVILRTAYRADSRYEWTAHAAIAPEYGMTGAEIERLRSEEPGEEWDARDRLLIAAADECAAGYRITSGTRDGLLAHYDARQLLDLLFTIGMYTTLAIMLETLEVPIDDTTTGFSAEKLEEGTGTSD